MVSDFRPPLGVEVEGNEGGGRVMWKEEKKWSEV